MNEIEFWKESKKLELELNKLNLKQLEENVFKLSEENFERFQKTELYKSLVKDCKKRIKELSNGG